MFDPLGPLPVRGAAPPEDAPIVEASLRALYLTPHPTISLTAYMAMKARAETAEAMLATYQAESERSRAQLRDALHGSWDHI